MSIAEYHEESCHWFFFSCHPWFYLRFLATRQCRAWHTGIFESFIVTSWHNFHLFSTFPNVLGEILPAKNNDSDSVDLVITKMKTTWCSPEDLSSAWNQLSCRLCQYFRACHCPHGSCYHIIYTKQWWVDWACRLVWTNYCLSGNERMLNKGVSLTYIANVCLQVTRLKKNWTLTDIIL